MGIRVRYFFGFEGRTALLTCRLYSAMSIGEQSNSVISKSAGSKWRGNLLRPIQGCVYILGSSIVTVSSMLSWSTRWSGFRKLAYRPARICKSRYVARTFPLLENAAAGLDGLRADGLATLWVVVRQDSVRLRFQQDTGCRPQAKCDSTLGWSTPFGYS
jgi:hypothetical protein